MQVESHAEQLRAHTALNGAVESAVRTQLLQSTTDDVQNGSCTSELDDLRSQMFCNVRDALDQLRKEPKSSKLHTSSHDHVIQFEKKCVFEADS